MKKGCAVMRWYGVVLWYGEHSLFPGRFGYVESSSAFAAIEFLMRSAGRAFVAYAAAIALDGSLRYRAYGVDLG
jgi:hypothetical protein